MIVDAGTIWEGMAFRQEGVSRLVEITPLEDLEAYVSRYDDDSTLMHAAAEYQETYVVMRLLKKGLEPDKVDKRGRTPLSIAAGHSHRGIARLLLEAGANPGQTKGGDSPLSEAVGAGNTGIVLDLLAAGADPNRMRPLFTAAGSGYQDIVELLVAYGAEPEMCDKSGEWIEVGNARSHFDDAVATQTKLAIERGLASRR